MITYLLDLLLLVCFYSIKKLYGLIINLSIALLCGNFEIKKHIQGISSFFDLMLPLKVLTSKSKRFVLLDKN